MKRVFSLFRSALIYAARILLLGMQHLLEGSWSARTQETARTDQA